VCRVSPDITRFPYPKIPVLCRVVRSAKREENSRIDGIQVYFLTINDSDRDLLVHISSEESVSGYGRKRVSGSITYGHSTILGLVLGVGALLGSFLMEVATWVRSSRYQP